MTLLIVRTDIEDNNKGRSMDGVDSAITFELYSLYRSVFHLTANHVWSKYIVIDEEDNYIGTFRSVDEMIAKQINRLAACSVITHEQWLNDRNPNWRTHPRYQYW